MPCDAISNGQCVDFAGKKGLGILKSRKVEPLSLKALIGQCAATQAAEMATKAQVVVAVHPEALEQKNFEELEAKCVRIREAKMIERYKRGEKSLGDELEERKVADLISIGEDNGINWNDEENRIGHALTKMDRSRIICKALSHGGDDDASRAAFQLEVLDQCPCEDVKCLKCRQWWHMSCSKHVGEVKHFKRCVHCQEYKKELKASMKDGDRKSVV